MKPQHYTYLAFAEQEPAYMKCLLSAVTICWNWCELLYCFLRCDKPSLGTWNTAKLLWKCKNSFRGGALSIFQCSRRCDSGVSEDFSLFLASADFCHCVPPFWPTSMASPTHSSVARCYGLMSVVPDLRLRVCSVAQFSLYLPFSLLLKIAAMPGFQCHDLHGMASPQSSNTIMKMSLASHRCYEHCATAKIFMLVHQPAFPR